MPALPDPPEPNAAPLSAVAEFCRRVCGDALPLWATRGFDHRRAAFHERLFLDDGAPDAAAPRRTMVQARQIYVYAHAAALGVFADGLPLAQQALETLLRRHRAPDGRPGYVHSVLPDGAVADATRDTYAHAFVLLALAWLHRAGADAQLLGLIDDALSFVDEHLTAPDGTLFEGVPRRLPRRQNPHMHFYEAMLALAETGAHPDALARADALRAHLHARFLDRATLTLGEFFDDAWHPVGDGDVVEPGHHAEWAWLLARHARIAGGAVDPAARPLLAFAARGADAATGLVFDGVARDGTPLRRSRRCWPQTELAKAWMAAHEAGEAGAAQAADRILRSVVRRYLSVPVAGGWIDTRDARGAPAGRTMPASALYHLFGAAAEARRVFGAAAGGVRG